MKKNKIYIGFGISVVLVLVVLFIFGLKNKFVDIFNITEKSYNINVEKVAITTLNDDDIFYDDLKDNYKGFKLIFVSANIKNNTQTNYDNLTYKLITSNNNEYGYASSSITNNKEFIENYYKINNKIFDDSTNDLLGGKNKRVIIAFMVPENEIINDTDFKLVIDSFDIENGDVENLAFNSKEIIKSYTMKELYKEEELEKAEQTMSLAYFSSVNDWKGWMIKLEQTYNAKYDSLFTVAFSAIHVFATLSDDYYIWNGKTMDNETGSKLDFEKAKEFYPSISEEIEKAKRAIDGIKSLNETYNNTINSLDKNKLQQVDSDVATSIFKINNFFELRYYF